MRGHVEGTLLNYFGTVHIYVLPSYREGTPRSCLRPPPAAFPSSRRTSLAAEVVKRGSNGYLVPSNDAKELAKAIHLIVDGVGETFGKNQESWLSRNSQNI